MLRLKAPIFLNLTLVTDHLFRVARAFGNYKVKRHAPPHASANAFLIGTLQLQHLSLSMLALLLRVSKVSFTVANQKLVCQQKSRRALLAGVVKMSAYSVRMAALASEDGTRVLGEQEFPLETIAQWSLVQGKDGKGLPPIGMSSGTNTGELY